MRPDKKVGLDKVGKLPPPSRPRRGLGVPIDDEVRAVDELEVLGQVMFQPPSAMHP